MLKVSSLSVKDPDCKTPLFLPKLTFEQIIEQMGLNSFNIRVFCFIGLFIICDGSEMVVLGLLTTKLTEVWDLTSFEKGALGSSIFIGFATGSLCSGYISDRNGRKPSFVIGIILVLLFASLSSLAQGFFTFVGLRIICGFGIGFAIPALMALFTELAPTEYRSPVLNNLWAVFPIGACFVIILTKFLINTESGWRYILLFASFPCIILLLLSWRMPESPRFLLNNGKFERGFQELDKIITLSGFHDKIILTEIDKQSLMNEIQITSSSTQETDYKMLFSPEYKKLTSLICSLYFLISFIYYGAVFIVPQIFEAVQSKQPENEGDIYSSMLLSAVLEIPMCIISGYLGNNKHLMRLGTMKLGFSVILMGVLIFLFFPNSLVFAVVVFKSGSQMAFSMIDLYTCEAYPTKIRAMGIGLGNTFNRIAAIFTPIISQILFDGYEKLPFIAFGFGAVFGVLACVSLPFETGGRALK